MIKEEIGPNVGICTLEEDQLNAPSDKLEFRIDIAITMKMEYSKPKRTRYIQHLAQDFQYRIRRCQSHAQIAGLLVL